jgi:zinc transport system substrate-binding protein
VVVSHAAFNYFAKRYNLEVINLAGLSPEEEPSAKQLAQISAMVKKNHIKYIFYETLVSPKLAETLARETGARAQVLNPIEGITSAEVAAGEDYFSLMRKNFSILKDALICQ